MSAEPIEFKSRIANQDGAISKIARFWAMRGNLDQFESIRPLRLTLPGKKSVLPASISSAVSGA
jgi:hypothetical protein